MPRANRHFLPGHVWHITHRCHKKEFLLRFSRDRSRWIKWLFEARKRYGLSVLNYVVTSNHIHLLVRDSGNQTIQRSMQLIASRTAQEYNVRKKSNGAFWEDRYHATAIDTESHLFRCLVYIDLNMVRAGIVEHPADWEHGGYLAIQNPPKRYQIIDSDALCELSGIRSFKDFQVAHREWVSDSLQRGNLLNREASFSEALAVGGSDYLSTFQSAIGIEHRKRKTVEEEIGFCIKEPVTVYNCDFAGEIAGLSHENTWFWPDVIGNTMT